jgi:hypothetical protein
MKVEYRIRRFNMWEQVRRFNVKNMGTKKGYCLQNVRLGFGIPPKYASAKIDMEANKRAGTLHNINTIPTNVAVPVYMDTSSKYEHIIVCDHGTYYSDGKRLTSTKGLKFFGWGEMCNGVRIVKEVKYTTGTYKVTASLLNVRTDAGISNRAKRWNELSPNARLQNKKLGNEKANGYLKGVVCTVTNVSGNWGLTRSGWICLDYCKRI